jgi:hypothetical protein
VSVPETNPVRGKDPRPDVGTYARTCADGDLVWAGDYLHTNRYLPGLRLQAVLNRQLRQRQSPTKAGRGGLSRREWKKMRSPSRERATLTQFRDCAA